MFHRLCGLRVGVVNMFPAPTTISVSGTSGSGKTTLLRKILLNKQQMFEDPPKRILYCYGIWQDLFSRMEKEIPDIEFHRGVPSEECIRSFGCSKEHGIVILDDLMSEISGNNNVQSLFTRGSHHLNLTVIWLSQNLFAQGKAMRTININTHIIILLANPRVAQISTLGSQLGIGKMLMESFLDATSTPYGYLVVDLSPHNHSGYKLCTNIIPGEDPVVYLPIN